VLDDDGDIAGCPESGCLKFEEAEQPDEPLTDFDLECKDEE
jgi:hypothetical protein